VTASARTVWLASYPKSGNTWLRAMLAALTAEADEPDLDIDHLGGGPIASSRAHMERWTGFASTDLTELELEWLRPECDAALDRSFDEVRVRKVHDALFTRRGMPIVPPEHTLAAIYLVRDPRDVAASVAHHSRLTTERAVAHLGDPDASIPMPTMLAGTQVVQHLGTWSDHLRSWTRHDLFPVEVVRYEDVLEDPQRELGRLARFAGLEPSEERLGAAVRAARFEVLSAKEQRGGFVERPWLERPFFRRGEAGAWREELAPELASRIASDHADAMAEMGYS
jgi:aryl sulfotransferase